MRGELEPQTDRHGLDKLPTGEPVRVMKGEDGSIDIRREQDNALWDGAKFVVPEPSLNRYAVTVWVNAIDNPTAVAIVTDALYDSKVDDVTKVKPEAELIAEGVG